MRRGARLQRLPGDGLFLYLRHSTNAWAFPCGQFLDPSGWQRIDEPGYLQPDSAYYTACLPGSSPPLSQVFVSSPPLVTCIMPTANRRAFMQQSIRYFTRQDYPHRELIVIDDGDDPVADLVVGHPQIRYERLPARRSVGAKRNLACQQAQGEIIVHWDDDDWSAPWRLSYQIDGLLKAKAELCGLSALNYYDPWTGRAWQYDYGVGGKPWVAGNTLCYRKDFWSNNPFPDVNIGEDSRFVWAGSRQQILALDDPSWFVALIHAGNVSPKRPVGQRWSPVDLQQVESLLGDDLDFYRQLGRRASSR